MKSVGTIQLASFALVLLADFLTQLRASQFIIGQTPARAVRDVSAGGGKTEQSRVKLFCVSTGHLFFDAAAAAAAKLLLQFKMCGTTFEKSIESELN